MRFSMLMLLCMVAVASVGTAAMRYGTWPWASAWFSLVLIIHLAAICGIRNRLAVRREFWFGFALFGWTYLIIANLPVLGVAEHQLIGTRLGLYLEGSHWTSDPSRSSSVTFTSDSSRRMRIEGRARVLNGWFALGFGISGGLICARFYRTRSDDTK